MDKQARELTPDRISYDIVPVPKPRMTQSDRWKVRPPVKRYRDFADMVKFLGISVENGDTVVFILPMPKSWSKSKREELRGKGHEQTPDVDNLAKALLDAIYSNDSHINDIRIVKRWGDEGAIEVIHNVS